MIGNGIAGPETRKRPGRYSDYSEIRGACGAFFFFYGHDTGHQVVISWRRVKLESKMGPSLANEQLGMRHALRVETKKGVNSRAGQGNLQGSR
jgi:hypothetical protein